jgi:DNA-binding MarR family transcriptional regulator
MTTESPIAGGRAAGIELGNALSRLHRSLRRRVRESLDGPAVPQSQVEILRVLQREPGLRARQIAEKLGLASNTVSTLLQQLALKGYVAREVDDLDRRSARITLTPAAVGRLTTWSDRRSSLLAAALENLDEADYRSLIGGLPALERLIAIVENNAHGE